MPPEERRARFRTVALVSFPDGRELAVDGTVEGTIATDTDTATVGYTDVAPAIHVVKTANPSSIPETGGTVTYSYEVTNTSPAGAFDPLRGVTLTDKV